MKQLFIDMDNTIMDFSKGDTDSALLKMSNPEYYSTLELIDDRIPDLLLKLKRSKWKIYLISGIPDYITSYEYINMRNYSLYWDRVVTIKDMTVDKYMSNIFDDVRYIMQSISKALYCKRNFHIDVNTYFIDDHKKYVNEWLSFCNQNAIRVTKEDSTVQILERLLEIG